MEVLPLDGQSNLAVGVPAKPLDLTQNRGFREGGIAFRGQNPPAGIQGSGGRLAAKIGLHPEHFLERLGGKNALAEKAAIQPGVPAEIDANPGADGEIVPLFAAFRKGMGNGHVFHQHLTAPVASAAALMAHRAAGTGVGGNHPGVPDFRLRKGDAVAPIGGVQMLFQRDHGGGFRKVLLIRLRSPAADDQIQPKAQPQDDQRQSGVKEVADQRRHCQQEKNKVHSAKSSELTAKSRNGRWIHIVEASCFMHCDPKSAFFQFNKKERP